MSISLHEAIHAFLLRFACASSDRNSSDQHPTCAASCNGMQMKTLPPKSPASRLYHVAPVARFLDLLPVF